MNKQKEHWDKSAELGALASVIDPNDKRGFKNLYISGLRDTVLERELPAGELSILDFGCGTGNLSKALSSRERRFTGIDISQELLEIAVQQNDPELCQFVLYDGGDIPLDDQSFDIAVTYGVLIHIVDDSQLITTLKNIGKTLKSEGRALFIEQTRKSTSVVWGGIKKQRSVSDFTSIFESAGFSVRTVEHVRKARFLPIYLIRYGFISQSMFPMLAKIDGFLANLFSAPRLSYVDTLFVLEKAPC